MGRKTLAMLNNHTHRVPQIRMLGLIIPPKRVQDVLDIHGLNSVIEKEKNPSQAAVMKIKKEGGPLMPARPKPLTRKEREIPAQVEAHKEERALYLEQQKSYDRYKSDRYIKLTAAQNVCLQLESLHELLIRPIVPPRTTPAPSVIKHIEKLQEQLTHPQPKQRKNEQSEHFQIRSQQIMELAKLCEKADLQDPDAVVDLANRIKNSDSDLENFIHRKHYNKERYRFNKEASVALTVAIDLILEELADYAVSNTIKSGYKTMRPDHCLGVGLKKLKFYPFIRNLYHLRLLRERKKRHDEWQRAHDKAKREFNNAGKHQAKREKVPWKGAKNFVFASFPEMEVTQEHAVRYEKTRKDGKTIARYKWHDLDTSKREDLPEFTTHTHKICANSIRNHAAIEGEGAEEIKISSAMTKFLSDLVLDFILRICPSVCLLVDTLDVSTINDKIILNVLHQVLLDSYANPEGKTELIEAHQSFFATIKEKCQMSHENRTKQNPKQAPEQKPASEKERL